MDLGTIQQVMDIIGTGGVSLLVMIVVFGSVLVVAFSIICAVIVWRSGYIPKAITAIETMRDQLREDNNLKEQMIAIIEEHNDAKIDTGDKI